MKERVRWVGREERRGGRKKRGKGIERGAPKTQRHKEREPVNSDVGLKYTNHKLKAIRWQKNQGRSLPSL